MKTWRTEYKILLALGVVFLITLVFFLIKNDTFEKMTQSYKQKQMTKCTKTTTTKGIEYTDYQCTIKDENGTNYTIEYPQITEKNKDIKSINNTLKKSFDKVYKSAEYMNIDKKLQLTAFQKINYKVYYANGIVSFLVEKQDIVGTVQNSVNQYKIYNIDATTYEVLDTDELKEKVGINRDYSSSIRGMVVKMYIDNFRYDYNNELPVYRNKYIDESVENVTYRAIDNLYIDDDGNIHFILYLYNPNYGESIPYNFTRDSNGNTTYKIFNEEYE